MFLGVFPKTNKQTNKELAGRRPVGKSLLPTSKHEELAERSEGRARLTQASLLGGEGELFGIESALVQPLGI